MEFTQRVDEVVACHIVKSGTVLLHCNTVSVRVPIGLIARPLQVDGTLAARFIAEVPFSSRVILADAEAIYSPNGKGERRRICFFNPGIPNKGKLIPKTVKRRSFIKITQVPPVSPLISGRWGPTAFR